eukprot:COSAG02_NODE_70784_length_193_cov_1352.797872_1_plen_51_part_10
MLMAENEIGEGSESNTCVTPPTSLALCWQRRQVARACSWGCELALTAVARV